MNSTIPVPICITPVSFYFHAGLLYRNDLPMPLRMRSEKHRYTSEYSIKSTAFQYTNPLILFSAINEAFSNQIRSLNIIKALHKYNKEKDELNPLCVIECKAPQNIAMHFAVTME